LYYTNIARNKLVLFFQIAFILSFYIRASDFRPMPGDWLCFAHFYAIADIGLFVIPAEAGI